MKQEIKTILAIDRLFDKARNVYLESKERMEMIQNEKKDKKYILES